MEQDFQFGLKNSRIVHISDVDSGLECNCYCPACGGRFVAYKGKVLRPHFKHHTDSVCNYSFETSLHYLAKEIIQEKKYLDIPVINWEIPITPSSWFSNHDSPNSFPPFKTVTFQTVWFDKIEIEKWEGNFKPDLKCYVGNKQLLIEITVTHGIDEEKLSKIKTNDVPLLEINLSGLHHEINKQVLAKALYGKKENTGLRLKNFKWIYNHKNDLLNSQQQLKSNKVFEFLKANQKTIKLYGRNKDVYNCPLLKKNTSPHSYADACEHCIYNLGKINVPNKRDEFSNRSADQAVRCIGHKQYELKNLLKECGAKRLL